MAIGLEDNVQNNAEGFVVVDATGNHLGGLYFVDTIADRDALGADDPIVSDIRKQYSICNVAGTLYVYTSTEITDAAWTNADNWGLASFAGATFNDLSDVDFTDLSDGDFILWDQSQAAFVNTNVSLGDVNVQPNWAETDGASDAFILNKPTIPTDLSDLGDINIDTSTLNEGDIIVWNDTTETFEAGDISDLISVINDLDDVDTASNAPTPGQVLVWNGATWLPGDMAITNATTDLSDVSSTAPTNLQLLQYNETLGEYVPVTLELDDIEGIDLTGAEEGDILTYNSTDGEWQPSSLYTNYDGSTKSGNIYMRAVAAEDLGAGSLLFQTGVDASGHPIVTDNFNGSFADAAYQTAPIGIVDGIADAAAIASGTEFDMLVFGVCDNAAVSLDPDTAAIPVPGTTLFASSSGAGPRLTPKAGTGVPVATMLAAGSATLDHSVFFAGSLATGAAKPFADGTSQLQSTRVRGEFLAANTDATSLVVATGAYDTINRTVSVAVYDPATDTPKDIIGIAANTGNESEIITDGVIGEAVVRDASGVALANATNMTTPGKKVYMGDGVGCPAHLLTIDPASGIMVGTVLHATITGTTTPNDTWNVYFQPSLLHAGASLIDSIDELSDVDTSTAAPTNGQVLMWNESTSNWEPASLAAVGDSNVQADWAETNNAADSFIQNKPVLVTDLNGLSDVDLSVAPTDGQALIYDLANTEWIAGPVASSMATLSDVDLTTTPPVAGQFITYDTDTQTFAPGTLKTSIDGSYKTSNIYMTAEADPSDGGGLFSGTVLYQVGTNANGQPIVSDQQRGTNGASMAVAGINDTGATVAAGETFEMLVWGFCPTAVVLTDWADGTSKPAPGTTLYTDPNNGTLLVTENGTGQPVAVMVATGGTGLFDADQAVFFTGGLLSSDGRVLRDNTSPHESVRFPAHVQDDDPATVFQPGEIVVSDLRFYPTGSNMYVRRYLNTDEPTSIIGVIGATTVNNGFDVYKTTPIVTTGTVGGVTVKDNTGTAIPNSDSSISGAFVYAGDGVTNATYELTTDDTSGLVVGIVLGPTYHATTATSPDTWKVQLIPALMQVALVQDAEQNVQSNWDETDVDSDAYIQNKPTLLSEFTNDTQFISTIGDLSIDALLDVDTTTSAPADGTVLTWSSGLNNWVPAMPLASGEVNVQSDWNETDTLSDSFINNKPTLLSQFTNDLNLGTTDIANFTSDVNVLIAANGGEANVQADWNETDNTSDAFIQNKPDLSSLPVADHSIGDHIDVDTTGAGIGSMLMYNGINNWVVTPFTFLGGAGTDGQVLTASGTGFAAFEDLPGSNLASLSDVDITTTPPTSNQALVYNEDDDQWEPGVLSLVVSANSSAGNIYGSFYAANTIGDGLLVSIDGTVDAGSGLPQIRQTSGFYNKLVGVNDTGASIPAGTVCTILLRGYCNMYVADNDVTGVDVLPSLGDPVFQLPNSAYAGVAGTTQLGMVADTSSGNNVVGVYFSSPALSASSVSRTGLKNSESNMTLSVRAVENLTQGDAVVSNGTGTNNLGDVRKYNVATEGDDPEMIIGYAAESVTVSGTGTYTSIVLKGEVVASVAGSPARGSKVYLDSTANNEQALTTVNTSGDFVGIIVADKNSDWIIIIK